MISQKELDDKMKEKEKKIKKEYDEKIK